MKKLLTLTLIAVCAAGALQAKQQTRPQPKPAFRGWHSAAITQPAEAPITDTKKLEKKIKKLNRKIRTLSANLTKASERGDEQKVRSLNAQLTKKRTMQRRYTLQLAALKSAEKKKEKVAKKTERTTKKKEKKAKKHEKKAGKSKSK